MYLDILKRLRDAIRRKRPERWLKKDWILLHDNARPHKAIRVAQYLAKHNIPELEHPPYSPDISPCDFFLFPRLKKVLKGMRFEDVSAIKTKTTEILKTITKTEFSQCFEQLRKRWSRCFEAEGAYFENF